MGDQERLARGVGGGIRELRLQDGAGAGEVRRDEPLPLGGEERRTELARPALAHLEQRLGDGPAQRACLEADLLDHPRALRAARRTPVRFLPRVRAAPATPRPTPTWVQPAADTSAGS